MKAIVQTGYGSPRDVLDLQEVTAPIAGDGEVLVRVKAASVHPDVWHVVTGLPLMLRVMGSGIRQPKVRIPGSDAAGVVESVGAGVTSLHPGDEVFGETLHGHGWHNGGAFAQYVTVAADALGHKPPKLTFEQAAGIPSSGYIALRAVRSEGRVDAGQNVLVNGAGGGVGTYAIQIAKAAGAEVTGVDRGEKLDTILSIGADHALDYTVDDFTTSGTRYDLIVDIPGNRPMRDLRRALSRKGTYVLVGHENFSTTSHRWLGRSMKRFLKLAVQSPFVRQRISPRGSMKAGDVLPAIEELLAGDSFAPLVDRTFPLGEAADALEYLTTGTTRGKVVLTL